MENYTEIIAQEHFSFEKSIQKILVFSKEDENVIRLLEITENTTPTGQIEPYVLILPNCPYPVHVAEITPAEWKKVMLGEIKLPSTWPPIPIREINFLP